MTKKGWDKFRNCMYLLLITNFVVACYFDMLASNVKTTIWVVSSVIAIIVMLVIENYKGIN